MNKKFKIVMYSIIGFFFLIVILLFNFISASQITTMNNSLSSENLTFTGDENITKYLEINRYANVTSAYMNLSGYKLSGASNVTSWWQDLKIEQPNIEECVEMTVPITGRYKVQMFPCAPSGQPVSTINVINVRNSSKDIIESLTVIDNSYGYTKNIYNQGDTYGWCVNVSPTGAGNKGICYAIQNTYPGYSILYGRWGPHTNITNVDYPNNPYLEIGTVDGTREWNYTGEFNETFSPDKTNDFSSILNTALNSGACDCDNCSLSGNNCTIPFLFHSDTIGKLEYSAINISYSDVDTTPPTHSMKAGIDETKKGYSAEFSMEYTDDIALETNGVYIFSTNNTGVWVNDSAVNFTTNPGWGNTTKILNNTGTSDTLISFRWYAKDNAGNWNNTGIYSFTAIYTIGISNCVDLQNMNNNLTEEYHLLFNIDCATTKTWNGGEGFIPIGNETDGYSFNGTFNGHGYTIFNLFIDRSTTGYQGLFGQTNVSLIRDVHLCNADITGQSNTGVLIGNAIGTNVSKCTSNGIVNGASIVGGLIGSIKETSAIIDSYSNVNVTATFAVGGLIGVMYDSYIANSSAVGKIISTVNSTLDDGSSWPAYAGGLVGSQRETSIIVNSFATGEVIGIGGRVGGLVGEILGSYIGEVYATGNASGNDNIGGLVGILNYSGSTQAYIIESYATGFVTGNNNIGGIVGYNRGCFPSGDLNGCCNDSYWDINTTGQATSDYCTGGAKNTTQMKTQTTFSGWDFTNTWIINASVNDGYLSFIWYTAPFNCQSVIDDVELIASGSSRGVGWFASIVLDLSGNLHIYHYDYDNYELKHCYGSWICDKVGPVSPYFGRYSSLAVDSNNTLHASMLHELVPLFVLEDGALFYCNDNSCQSLGGGDTSADNSVGRYTSIAIDTNDYVHISYQNISSGALQYCTNSSGTGWNCSHLTTGNNIGRSDIAIDKNNKVHIVAYNTSPAYDTIYCTDLSGSWDCSILDSSQYQGYMPRIAIDSNNILHVVTQHWDYYHWSPAYCWKTNTIGGSWSCSIIEDNVGVDGSGYYPSIALDSTDNVHVQFIERSTSGVNMTRYCRKDGAGWWCENIGLADGPYFGYHPSPNSLAIKQGRLVDTTTYSSSVHGVYGYNKGLYYWHKSIQFASPNAPSLTGISLSETYAKQGDNIVATAIGEDDINNDVLSMYCCNGDFCIPSISNHDFCYVTGDSTPYDLSCTGQGISGNGVATVRCRVYDGSDYSTIESDTYRRDNSAPSVSISEPQAIYYYTNINISLNYTATDMYLDECWYNVIDDTGGSIIGNTVIAGCLDTTFSLPGGDTNYTLTLYADDKYGYVGSDSVTFGITDNVFPLISIIYPLNNTNYTTGNVDVNYIAFDVNLDMCWYTNNSGLEKYIITCGDNITTINWRDGSNTVIVHVNDTSGNENSSSVIFNVDTTSPIITIFEPKNQNYADNDTMKLNYSVIDTTTSVDACWYNVINSTGDIIISNTTLASCDNSTFGVPGGDINYNLTLYSNDTLGHEGSVIVEFGIRTDVPAISLDTPLNNEWFTTTNNNYFNFTATDSNGIDECRLYSNFTGSWIVNETFSGIINGTQNYTTKNLSDNTYMWNVWCNDTLGNSAYSIANFTVGVDVIIPNLVLNYITTTTDSQTIIFNSTASDTNLDSCRYTIYDLTGAVDATSENVIYNCTAIISATVSGFATYNLTIYASDLAGNENVTSALFTTTATGPPGPGPGGGGGGITITPSDMNWTLETEAGKTRYQFNMVRKTFRTKNLVFENMGGTSPQIKLHCEESIDSPNLCDYITYEENNFYLPVQLDTKYNIGFTVTIPKNASKGDYIGNIIATDDKNNIAVLTTEVNMETFGPIVKFFVKITSSKIINGVQFPYFFMFLIFVLTVGFSSSYGFKKAKLPRALGLVVGLTGGFIIILIL